MSRDYAKEKFYTATLSLATGEGSIHERLESAALGLIAVKISEDIPNEARADFEALMADLTAKPAVGDEGTLHATIRQMEPHEAAKFAERIFDMYFRVLGTRPL